MTEAPTSVYIIACGDRVKIGVSADPTKRLKDMSTAMQEKPLIYATRELASRRAAMSIERALHRRFHRRRTHGEWFSVSPREAAAALRRALIPSDAHLASDKWSGPTDRDAAEAVDRVFGEEATLV